jgi:hypothetical protein
MNIQTGDILAYIGNGDISSKIRTVQHLTTGLHSPFSHVGMAIVSQDGELRVFEADDRVRNIDFEKTIEDGSEVHVFRRKIPLTDAEKTKLINASKKLEGLKYDKMATYKIALNVVLRWVGLGFKNKADKDFFCSELIKKIYINIGIKFKTDKNGYCLPIHIVSDKNFIEVKDAFAITPRRIKTS